MNFIDFISEHSKDNVAALRLKVKPEDFDFDLNFALLQIEARRKHSSKLGSYLLNKEFLFPDNISGEQATHQSVAKFHADIIGKGNKILDMTAGLGIDTFSFAAIGNKVTAVELNPRKADILAKNAKSLNLENQITVRNEDSLNFLSNTTEKFDVIFADPARRDINERRVYNLRDCSPDILQYQDLLKNHADKILIKASPLLDITQTLKDFKDVSSIYVVGVKGECKEILVEIDSELNSDHIIAHAINLDSQGNIINSFSQSFPQKYLDCRENKIIFYATMEDLKEGEFILEPSAMMMKLAPWTEVCRLFNAKKLDKSSHVFISSECPENFPGRVTVFQNFISKKDRDNLKGIPASVVSKNHPLSPDEIRKNLRLKEGDQNFIYATSISSKPVMFLSKSF